MCCLVPATAMDTCRQDSQLQPAVAEGLCFSASFAKRQDAPVELNLTFLFRNHRKGLLCEPSHVLSIDSRGDKDLTLLEFLMSITADVPKRCPAVSDL